MADISQYLQAIMSAVYGEDVRGSIHDAIEIINNVSEVVLSVGTAVDSASSSSTGFFEDSLYLNSDTYELWKCVGTDSWSSQGILKGAAGADGNKWYRGIGISGKAVNPTVYSGSGVANANPNDFYLNPSEGAVYHCVTGGDASTATWAYDFTMTGGGGGSSSWGSITGTLSDQTDLQTALNGKIAKSATAGLVKNDGTIDTNSYAKSSEVEQTLRDAEVIEGKNKLHVPDSVVSSGIFTVNRNNDGEVTSIVANGTGASGNSQITIHIPSNVFGDLIISGCPSGGAVDNYDVYAWDLTANARPKKWDGTTQSDSDYGNGAEVKLVEGHDTVLIIRIFSGKTVSNLPFYPMVCTDDEWNKSHDFEPYYIPLKDSKFDRAEQAVLGTKNLLVNERGNSTIEGVTFVVNADGTVTASGTPSNNNAFYDFYNPLRPIGKIPAGRYIFSGTPSGIDTIKYNMYVEIGGPGNNLYDYGNGVTFDYNGTDTLRFAIGIRTSAVSNLTFKPMLRLASDPDDTYAPHAMTNLELTEKVDKWKATTATVSSGSFSFSGLDDTKGWAYKPYVSITGSSTNKNPTAQISSISGAGTSSMSVTYTTDADNGATVKLRIIK